MFSFRLLPQLLDSLEVAEQDTKSRFQDKIVTFLCLLNE